MASIYKIATLGLWHLGEIYSACLAEMGHTVIGLSEDAELIENFKKSVPPLAEPELESLLKKNQAAGRLQFSTDFSEIKNCNTVWFTFDTPVDENDEVNLSPIYANLEKILPHLQNGVLIVMTSQVPVGEGSKIKTFIQARKPGLNFDYAYTPENLRLGAAVKHFMEPGRIVIGGDAKTTQTKVAEIFAPLKTNFLFMSLTSSEMAKHAINAFLATSVSFINDIADACEACGADVLEVACALRSEPRIGPRAFLDAGLGFSGGTLGRDLKILMKLGRLPVIENVYKKNLTRNDKVITCLETKLNGLNGKVIALFGLTYKPGTRTLRRSRALEISKLLKAKGAIVSLHDPETLREEVVASDNSSFSADPYEAAKSALAIVLVTPWPDFQNLDFKKLSSVTKTSALFFDTPNFLWDKKESIEAAGFSYLGIGR